MMNFDKSTFSKRLTSLVLCLVMALMVVLGGCDDDNTATADSAGTDAVDTQSFVFTEDVTICGVNLAGLSFDAAFQAVEAVALDTVCDFELTIIADDKEYSYTKDNFNWSFNIQDVLNEAALICESTTEANTVGSSEAKVTDLPLTAEVDADSVDWIVNAVAQEVNAEAVDSTFTVDGDKVIISREQIGKSLDTDDLKSKIIDEVGKLSKGDKKTASVEAVINDVEPERKYEQMNGEIKLISTYSTYSTNTADGNHNMMLALAACDGSVINPGEVWSFNACTGNSNLTSLGYRPATVIAGGKFQQGIGGGICQASTTIYNAAVLADMEITERYYHYYQSSYAAAGRDATIDYPNLDLKLSNPTDYPMYMQCYMEGTKLTVNIYGWDNPAFDKIEIESFITGSNSEGYSAEAYRVYYLDGKEIEREQLPKSWYAYPEEEEETSETTKATKPKATTPKATKPKATKPNTTATEKTEPATTTPVTTDPVEPTTTPQTTEPTKDVSQNDQQIETATAHY